MERAAERARREVNEVRTAPGWETVRIAIDSRAIVTVGPKEFAKAFEVKTTLASQKGIAHTAAERRRS